MDTSNVHANLALLSESGDSYRVSLKRGSTAGIAVSVSGAGAWAKLKGNMTFKIQRLEVSKTYHELRDKYKFGGGVSAFWSWIGINVGGEKEHEEITKTFHEVQESQDVDGSAEIDLSVTGQYPNVEVTASAFILIFEVEDKQGNTFHIASSGEPGNNTGSQDQNGTALPTRDNTSTIQL